MRLSSLASRRHRFERDYVFIASIFAVLMVLTNLIGTKLFLLFPSWLPEGFGWVTDHHYVVLTTGLVTYPLTFLFTDVCAEVYGRRRANHMVTIGFLASLLMLAVIHLAAGVPRADRYWADAAAQPEQGTVVLATAAAGSERLAVDDAGHLLFSGRERARAAVLQPGTHTLVAAQGGEESQVACLRPIPFDHTALERPLHRVPGPDDQRLTVPLRQDHRGELVLAACLPTAVPAGSWVVPAVVIRAVAPDGALVVDRPRLLPPTGELLSAGGSLLTYQSCSDEGVVALAPAWNNRVPLAPADLTVGQTLAVYNLADPAALQQNLVSIVSAPAILLFASMLAYLVAQFLDVWIYHAFKVATDNRFLWLRNNGSTMISQLVDTIIVNGIFLPVAFGMGAWDTTKVIIGVYIVKLVLAWLDTPLIYLGVWWAKRRLGHRFSEEVDLDLLGTFGGYEGDGVVDEHAPPVVP